MEYPLSSQAAVGFESLKETGSTNRDLLDRAVSCEEFFVLTTEFQTSGRGRLDRRWEAAPGSSVMASMLLKPKFQDPSGVGWLSLLAALAINQALAGLSVISEIKWPNDVLIGGIKVSGVLAEASEDLTTVVLGFGINVFQKEAELPVGNATSLSIETGREVNRDELLATVIENIKSLYGELVLAEGNAQLSGLRDAIIQASATIGQQVSVAFPSSEKVVGLAKDIDQSGRLVVETSRETLSVSAGDVLHLRSN